MRACESKDGPQAEKVSVEERDRRVDRVMGDTAEGDQKQKDCFICKCAIQVGARTAQGQEEGLPLSGHTVSYWRCCRVTQLVAEGPGTQTQGQTSKTVALHSLKVRQPQTRREQILRGAVRGSQRSRFVCFIKKVLESLLSPLKNRVSSNNSILTSTLLQMLDWV